MLAPVRSAPLKSERFNSALLKLEPAALTWAKFERFISAALKLAPVRLACAKLARQPSALVKSDRERSAPSNRVRLTSVSLNLAPAIREAAKSLKVRSERWTTMPVRSSFVSMRRALEHPDQSTPGAGASWHFAMAGPVQITKASRTPAILTEYVLRQLLSE